ncbi:hypothetical protein F5Y07DRAFT_397021 [Xylaria sp. FL0933]|nr:hypothetical protein F5Y07DRAFT_397021 [Xylaria sp. FL0933]
MWSSFDNFNEDQVFTGSIEDVVDQMRQIKGPNYTPDFAIMTETQALAGTSTYHEAEKTMTVQCGAKQANPRRIMDGIYYLQHLGDHVMCTNAPQSCGRISCSWSSGIFWCNDKTVPSDAYKCKMFGNYARIIVNECAIYDRNPRVCGLLHDSEFDLTTVVKWARC